MPPIPPNAPPVRPSSGAPSVQRRCAQCEGDECACAQKKPIGLAQPTAQVDASALAGGGQPLSAETREFFEPRFGYDFSRVRVHSDDRAATSARALNAEAYTVGRDIVFGDGRYDPRGHAGRELLAHELAHVVQQAGRAPAIQRRSRGPGGCGWLDALAATTIGSAAHTQIQAILATRGYQPEFPVPRATKANQAIFSLGCPDPSVPTGYVDLAMTAGAAVGFTEIKPFYLTALAEAETLHYIRRAMQSRDRLTSTGPCAGSGVGADDAMFSARVGGMTAATQFAAAAGVINGTETFGPFSEEPTHLLKAKEVAPGAIGYWCTKIDPGEEEEEEEEEEKNQEEETEADKEAQKNETPEDEASADDAAELEKQQKAKEKTEKSEKENESETDSESETDAEKPTDEPSVEGEKPPVEGEPIEPEAPVGAGAANVGFGISIFSMSFGAANAGVGVSVFSVSGGLGTASAGVSWFSNSLAAGAAGIGAAIDNQSAGALTAGAGISKDSDTAGAVTAGAGSIKDSASAGAVTAGAGTVDNSTTAGAVVAGHGSLSGVSGSASVTTGSGDVKDVKGGAGDKPATDTKTDPSSTSTPSGTAQGAGGVGATGATGTNPAGPTGTNPAGTTGTPGGTAGTPGGTTGTPGGTAGTPGGTAATPGGTAATPGGTTAAPGGAAATPGATPPTPDQIAVAAVFPPSASKADKDKIIADAKRVAQLLQASSDSQKELMKYLASQEPNGTYLIPTSEWVEKLMKATEGMSPEDILYLEQLHWVPGHVSPEELRKKLQDALAKRKQTSAAATGSASSGSGANGNKAGGAAAGTASGDTAGADNKSGEPPSKATGADSVTAPPADADRTLAGVFPFEIVSGMSQFGSYTKGQSVRCTIRVKNKGEIFVLNDVAVTFDHRSDVPVTAASGQMVETTFGLYFTKDFWSPKHKLYGLGGADTLGDYGWGRHKKP